MRTRVDPRPDLLGFRWNTPLLDWPDDEFVRLPNGLHRHVVRFFRLERTVYALKELPDTFARRECEMITLLRSERLPAVTLVGVATGRTDDHGEPLGALRAYLVDAETAKVHPNLSEGQRRRDVLIGAENVAGGLLDLAAQGRSEDDIDPAQVADGLIGRYESLWTELTAEEDASELWRIHVRLQRLNELGFDTEEVHLAQLDGGRVRFGPSIVEEGHHKRQLDHLAGIRAHENQARRLLSAMRGYGAWLSSLEGRDFPEAVVAYRWLTERW